MAGQGLESEVGSVPNPKEDVHLCDLLEQLRLGHNPILDLDQSNGMPHLKDAETLYEKPGQDSKSVYVVVDNSLYFLNFYREKKENWGKVKCEVHIFNYIRFLEHVSGEEKNRSIIMPYKKDDEVPLQPMVGSNLLRKSYHTAPDGKHIVAYVFANNREAGNRS